MLPDIENMDIILGSNHQARDEIEFSNSVRRPESPSYKTLVNNELSSHPNSRENEIRDFASHGCYPGN